MSSHLTIGQCATLACVWEVTIPKPGNVHRGADFDNVGYLDFLTSAVVIAPAIEAAPRQPVGQTILEAVQATEQWVGSNTNLGMILLIAPLAAVPREQTLSRGIADVMQRLDGEDARLVYQAIELARPAGMGRVEDMDVSAAPPGCLVTAMRAAADRDLVARQYANNYVQLLENVAPWLCGALERGWSIEDVVVHVHLRLMSTYPDSLIARKCGSEVAEESARRAAATLSLGEPGEVDYYSAVADLDRWLRSDGHRRNPGTTADMIAAGLFTMLREEIIGASGLNRES
ncbi:MAG: triphosphoribosyl-dephospho-CoA synthase [Planctomycetales bacterium]